MLCFEANAHKLTNDSMRVPLYDSKSIRWIDKKNAGRILNSIRLIDIR